jgi:hypothetical protein
VKRVATPAADEEFRAEFHEAPHHCRTEAGPATGHQNALTGEKAAPEHGMVSRVDWYGSTQLFDKDQFAARTDMAGAMRIC